MQGNLDLVQGGNISLIVVGVFGSCIGVNEG